MSVLCVQIKKTSNGVSTYYIILLFEVTGGIVTTTEGTTTVDQLYCAYGRQRTVSGGVSSCPGGNSLPTGHTFTGQKLDGTGLQYYNARYYDPAIGTFISPDTIVPDATNVFDYNRYMYASGNPLKFSDPTGHCNAAGGLSGRMISADSCGGWGAGVAARAAIQLGVDTAGIVILVNSAVQAERSHQESVPLPQPTVEVSGVPLQDQTPHSGWITSFDAPPQSQVLADPLPAPISADNLVVDVKIGPRWGKREVDDPVCRSGCENVAKQIQKLIGGERYRLTPEGPSIGGIDGKSSEWVYHEVVVKDGRVYDLLTGYLGQLIADYRNRYEEDEGITWKQIDE